MLFWPIQASVDRLHPVGEAETVNEAGQPRPARRCRVMYAGVPSAEAADELDCFASAAEDDCALCLVVIWMCAHVIHLHPLQSLVSDLDCFAKRPCADEFAILVIPIACE